MKILRAFVFGAAAVLAMAASAQWQWIDKDGRAVFSDRAPPVEVPARAIVKQPGPRGEPAVSAAATDGPSAAAPGAATNALRLSGRDKELEERRKQAESAEADKRKLEQEKYAKARADSCERARQAKMGLDSGARVARSNAQGEREFLDDEARAAETRRLQGIIDASCQ